MSFLFVPLLISPSHHFRPRTGDLFKSSGAGIQLPRGSFSLAPSSFRSSLTIQHFLFNPAIFADNPRFFVHSCYFCKASCSFPADDHFKTVSISSGEP